MLWVVLEGGRVRGAFIVFHQEGVDIAALDSHLGIEGEVVTGTGRIHLGGMILRRSPVLAAYRSISRLSLSVVTWAGRLLVGVKVM